MIQIDQHEDIAVVRMEHGKANAIDTELFMALANSLDEIQSSSAKGIVLTGSGRIFSAGVDLFRLLEGGVEYTRSFLDVLHDGFMKLFTFPKPVIAAVNGHAIAGGCIMVQACDYRLMAEGRGTIGVPERVVGVPFPTSAMETLRFAVPSQHLQELVYRGKTYDVQTALKMGLVDEVVAESELIETAVKLAGQMGHAASGTFQMTKEQLREPVITRIEETRAELDARAAKIWMSDEARDSIQSFLEARVGKK